MVFSFTGTGNVSKGARDMFELLPHEYIDAKDLPQFMADVKSGRKKANNKTLYGVIVDAHHMVAKLDGTPIGFKDQGHYFSHPEQYKPVFHENIAPHTTMVSR